ncbi:MAG: hypothetical protein ACK6DS_01570, partial [Planctomycetota bacterium]
RSALDPRLLRGAMTTYIESIVDTDATLDEADDLARAVVANLCDCGIILPTPQTHKFLANGPRYATGPNVLNAVDAINDCFPCGMDVSIGRNVYDTGQLGFELFCPNCKHRFDTEALDWTAPVGCWYDSGIVTHLECPKCSAPTSFTKWFSPPFGFGNLAFQFYEWFLKQEFVDHVSKLLHHQVIWVKAQY